MGAAVVGVTGEILSTTFFAPARMKTPVFMRYSAHGGDCAPRSERASCRGAAQADPGPVSATDYPRRAVTVTGAGNRASEAAAGQLHRMQLGASRKNCNGRSSSWSCGWKSWNRVVESQSPTCPNRLPLRSPRLQRNRRVAPCPIICRGKRGPIRRKKPYVRNAKANCASWAQMFRRCWSTCPPVSW